ncbi:protein MAIN-LIKE 1-like [Diospyros lotus]|uniref:protein MAIN-LIKE 1-like n=1 Tax=Diospyros lotus TaxID=55363 RepID=UPI00225640E5|nr:protein MAIN-LIKE 1-like [Diospyros lotus]
MDFPELQRSGKLVLPELWSSGNMDFPNSLWFMVHYMVRGRRRGEASSSHQPSSSSRERPTASTRRRMRTESSSEQTILEEEPVADYVTLVEKHPNPNQREATDQLSYSQHDDDISKPLPEGPSDRSILKSFKNYVAFAIWAGEPLDNQPRVRDIVMDSSLSPLLECTYRNINHAIVSAFTERWQSETNTFHLPFGEISITLYDVAAILKIPVTGRSVSVPHHLTPSEASDLLYKSGTLVSVTYLTLLDDLSMIGNYVWGAACLAYLYRQLGIATRREVKSIAGYLTLLEGAA